MSNSEMWRGTLGDLVKSGGGSIQTGPFGSQLHESDYVASGTPIVTVEHLVNGRLSAEAAPQVSASDAKRLTRYSLEEGDIVFSRVGAIDRSAYVRRAEAGWLFSGRLLRVRPGTKVNSQFLAHLLGAAEQQRWIYNHSVGSTMLCLNTRILSDVPVAVPSPEEQSRIADLLSAVDEQIGSIEAQIAKRRLQFVGLQRTLLSCSSLKEADVDDVLLRELIPVVQYGISTSLEPTGVVPVLRMNNLGGGEIDVSDLKYSPRRVRPELLLKDGDVLFNRTNSMEHVGRTSIWRSQLAEATFASYLVRLLPDENRITKEYLVYLLGWDEHQTQMRRYATPGVQQVNINPTNLRLCRVRIPRKLSSQQRVVEALDACREYISALTADVEKLRLKKRGLALHLLTNDGRASS